ncbi:hypothetical protein K469DRAFT_691093 [Zopfia rhizophila CBS 207.26]|uniref:Uncharacterized protein n=1 Tax=Zopfia rhizophila CBS 207.26 TaxID=1314779 RepID=A0A6A6ES21_9PEZI|nr:hypothetical protein K469DRAFT_691093 [Zopfia rhizophila CBS 207.26]
MATGTSVPTFVPSSFQIAVTCLIMSCNIIEFNGTAISAKKTAFGHWNVSKDILSITTHRMSQKTNSTHSARQAGDLLAKYQPWTARFVMNGKISCAKPTPDIPDDEVVVVTPAQFRHLSFRGDAKADSEASIRVAGKAKHEPPKARLSQHSLKSVRGGVSSSLTASEAASIEPYDPADYVLTMENALSSRPVDENILIDIVPWLLQSQMDALRVEYKWHVEVHNHGINIAKHIRAKVFGLFGRLAHVTALGQWESEALWTNE